MAALTPDELYTYGQSLVDLAGASPDILSLVALLPVVKDIVDHVDHMSDDEKKSTAANLVDYVLDNTDTPWLVDRISDPLMSKAFKAFLALL